MEDRVISLDNIKLGIKYTVLDVNSRGKCRRRLLDLGIIKGTAIEAVHASPIGNPRAYLIRGTLIAIRNEDAKNIIVTIQDSFNITV